MINSAVQLGECKKSYRVLDLQRIKISFLTDAAKKAYISYSGQLSNMFSTKIYLPRISTFVNAVLNNDKYVFYKSLLVLALINLVYYLLITSRYFQNSIFSRFVRPSTHIFFTLCSTLCILFAICLLYPVPS